uniref:hypothetical protein n=1 Tax=Klebsiella sp. TaxID=576 RepID=UPI0031CE0524
MFKIYLPLSFLGGALIGTDNLQTGEVEGTLFGVMFIVVAVIIILSEVIRTHTLNRDK